MRILKKKILKQYAKEPILKLKNSFLESEKDFIDFKDRELQDREVQTEREIEKIFLKLIIVSIDDMDKFEQKEIKNKKKHLV